ncbi:WD repeat protein Lub1 [Coemansia javaensis]|uniref:WD repeat protein Lub1 n=1 Tax=Coemansia javaensis TaxID=2761396 RepID=A0A9W8LHF5_9FUNG|nr:WD repeat protein Lub1 [Coemansia javaensis]
MASYRLSAELAGHAADVRGVACQGSDVVVSVSRDGTGRIWRRAAGGGFDEAGVLAGHEGFVTAVAALGDGSVATGAADGVVRLWDAAGAAAGRLEGHTGNVCALTASADGRVVVSGSWDGTARVWDAAAGTCRHTLAGHGQAVWAVLVLGDGSVVTGAADRRIRRWVDGRLAQTYDGHADCVRALAATADGGFASASNDGTVRVWGVDGTCRAELHGHTAFVYALAALPDGALVSGGEDRSVRVWRGGRLAHTILVPATSVWAVAALPNGDVACGASDGRVRIFTLSAARAAPAAAIEALERANAAFALSARTMGGLDTAKLPGPERLERPGDRDQQVIMVRDGTAVTAHQWAQDQARWLKVGEVVDAVGQAQKQLFDGREYDYVFDVDIQDGAPPLKLPYNASENPYAAAQRFLERNELPIGHLDTVVDFITRNTAGVALGPDGAPPHADPFTGASRYIPGPPASASASASASAAQPAAGDPFTGASRYVPVAAAAAPAAGGYVPPSDFVLSRRGNGAAIVAKLAEFNDQLAPGSGKLSADQMLLVRGLAGLGGDAPVSVSEAAYAALAAAAERWPEAMRFPALDLVRLAAADSAVPVAHAAAAAGGFAAWIGAASGLLALPPAPSPAAQVNAMMGARALANACATAAGADAVWAARAAVLAGVDGAWARIANKNLATALATLLLNLAILAARRADDDAGLDVLAPASRFLAHSDNPDAQLRLLSVFGVLAARFPLCKDSARVLGDETIVALAIQGKTPAVRQAAKEIEALLVGQRP